MTDQMMRLVVERRRRLVATIMGHAEREFFSQLTPAQQQEFRRKTLQGIDDFVDLVRDVLKISGEDVIVNGHALELLEALHDSHRDLARRLT